MRFKQYTTAKVSARVNFSILDETIPIRKTLVLSIVEKVPSAK